MKTDPYLFQLRNVSKTFSVRKGIFKKGTEFKVLDGINLTLRAGLLTGVVGESGSGKTTLARLMAGLIHPTEGEVLFEQKNLTEVLKATPLSFRRRVQMIFQNPYLSLDSKWTIREILEEGIREFGPNEKQKRVEESLNLVHLENKILDRKPHALSGGQRQRVAIARALAMKPEYLILDEPTSQLDVTVQFQIITLLKDLGHVFRGGMLFITHDLALASHLVDQVLVMDQGKIIESGTKREVLGSPKQAQTQRLINAIIPCP